MSRGFIGFGLLIKSTPSKKKKEKKKCGQKSHFFGGGFVLQKDDCGDQAAIKAVCLALVSQQMCSGIRDHLRRWWPPGGTSCPAKTGALMAIKSSWAGSSSPLEFRH